MHDDSQNFMPILENLHDFLIFIITLFSK